MTYDYAGEMALATPGLTAVFRRHLAGLQRLLQSCGVHYLDDLQCLAEALCGNILRAERMLGRESDELIDSCRLLVTSFQERRVTSCGDYCSGFAADRGTNRAVA